MFLVRPHILYTPAATHVLAAIWALLRRTILAYLTAISTFTVITFVAILDYSTANTLLRVATRPTRVVTAYYLHHVLFLPFLVLAHICWRSLCIHPARPLWGSLPLPAPPASILSHLIIKASLTALVSSCCTERAYRPALGHASFNVAARASAATWSRSASGTSTGDSAATTRLEPCSIDIALSSLIAPVLAVTAATLLG